MGHDSRHDSRGIAARYLGAQRHMGVGTVRLKVDRAYRNARTFSYIGLPHGTLDKARMVVSLPPPNVVGPPEPPLVPGAQPPLVPAVPAAGAGEPGDGAGEPPKVADDPPTPKRDRSRPARYDPRSGVADGHWSTAAAAHAVAEKLPATPHGAMPLMSAELLAGEISDEVPKAHRVNATRNHRQCLANRPTTASILGQYSLCF